MTNRFRICLGILVSTVLLTLVPAAAQPMRGPGGPGFDGGFGPGMMMGPGMMRGRGMHNRMCGGPGGLGFSAWRINAIEQALKPDDAQRAKLSELETASAKAAEMIRDACPTEFPATPTARLEIMEKRMEASLQAVKLVRPAFDAFYNSLNDEQKAKLNANAPGSRHFWRWRNHW